MTGKASGECSLKDGDLDGSDERWTSIAVGLDLQVPPSFLRLWTWTTAATAMAQVGLMQWLVMIAHGATVASSVILLCLHAADAEPAAAVAVCYHTGSQCCSGPACSPIF